MFVNWMDYKGTQLQRHETKDCYRFATAHKAFDADGAPNAYHPNNTGLDDNANAGYGARPKKGWKDVLVPDPNNQSVPYVQKSGEFQGYFVSQTALKDIPKDDIDITKYVDSRHVPYLVFPGPFATMAGTGRLGDIGFAYNLANQKSSPFIIADIGPPDATLGEMSIALGHALGGLSINPRNGAGAPQGRIVYVIFRYSSAQDSHKRWPLSALEIEGICDGHLQQIGGVQAAIDGL